MFRFYIYVNMSRLGIRHCLNLFKSKFKSSQATERRVQNLWSLTDRKKGSTDRKSYSADFKSSLKPTKIFRVCVQHNLI